MQQPSSVTHLQSSTQSIGSVNRQPLVMTAAITEDNLSPHPDDEDVAIISQNGNLDERSNVHMYIYSGGSLN